MSLSAYDWSSPPDCQVLWYKETMKLIEGDRLQLEQIGDTYKLTLRRVRLQDYGRYYCRASNLLDREVSRSYWTIFHILKYFLGRSAGRWSWRELPPSPWCSGTSGAVRWGEWNVHCHVNCIWSFSLIRYLENCASFILFSSFIFT